MITFLGIAQKKNEVILYFLQKEGKDTFFKEAVSSDGFVFGNPGKYIFALDTMQQEEQSYNWDSIRVGKHDYTYLLTYKNHGKKNGFLQGAVSSNGAVWQKLGNIDSIKETG